jgi:hypothetical protein
MVTYLVPKIPPPKFGTGFLTTFVLDDDEEEEVVVASFSDAVDEEVGRRAA